MATYPSQTIQELKERNAYLEGARDALQSMLNKERTKT